MGRPSLGERKQINIRLPVDLLAEIDALRGVQSRDAWFTGAARIALKPISQYVEPDVRPQHQHTYVKPISTRISDGVKYRTRACACGMEQEAPA